MLKCLKLLTYYVLFTHRCECTSNVHRQKKSNIEMGNYLTNERQFDNFMDCKKCQKKLLNDFE